MRVGVLGGTFDPPHMGHLKFAEAAIEVLELDEVLFMPAHRNPTKKQPPTANAKQRFEMVKRLTRSQEKMAVSDLEITRRGPSYTVDTMTELQMAQPAEYWLLVGADAVKALSEWKQPHRLVRLCRLGVALRPPATESGVMASIAQEYKQYVDIVRMQPADISSTELRDRLSKGRPVAPWITPDVLDYIKKNELYRG